jgi:hypothetical protein
MGVVHSLECDTGVIAVEVAVLNEILDGIDNLHVRRTVSKLRGLEIAKHEKHTFFRMLACSKRASSIFYSIRQLVIS